METNDWYELENEIWQSLSRASLDSKHPFRYPVVANLKSQEESDLRIMVLRKVEKAERKLVFYTDSRSPKVRQWLENPNTSILFYHPRQKWQIRAQGKVQIMLSDQPMGGPALGKDYRGIFAPGEELNESKKKRWELEQTEDSFFLPIHITIYEMDDLKLSEPNHHRFKVSYQNEKTEFSWLAP